ncbi:hypothetical protein Ahia01_001267600, partial [Argonauta hians]
MAQQNKELTEKRDYHMLSPCAPQFTSEPINSLQKQVLHSSNQHKQVFHNNVGYAPHRYSHILPKSHSLLLNLPPFSKYPHIVPRSPHPSLSKTQSPPLSNINIQNVPVAPVVHAENSTDVSNAVSPYVISISNSSNSSGSQTVLVSNNKQISTVPPMNMTNSAVTTFASTQPTFTTNALSPYALCPNIQGSQYIDNTGQNVFSLLVPSASMAPSMPVVLPINTTNYNLLQSSNKLPNFNERGGVMNVPTQYPNIYSSRNIPVSNVVFQTPTNSTDVVPNVCVQESGDVHPYRRKLVCKSNVKPKIIKDASHLPSYYNQSLLNKTAISNVTNKPDASAKLLVKAGKHKEMSDCDSGIKVGAVWSIKEAGQKYVDVFSGNLESRDSKCKSDLADSNVGIKTGSVKKIEVSGNMSQFLKDKDDNHDGN